MRRRFAYALVVVILAVAWEYFGGTNSTVRLLISRPSLIGGYFAENTAALWDAFVTTSLEALLGLSIGFALSMLLVVLCMRRPKVFDALLPLMVISQVTPMIVLAPFFVLLMGIGIASKVSLAAIMCFFPIYISAFQGYRTLPPSVHDLADVYNAKPLFRIRKIYLPLIMPSIMAGLRVSATLSVIGAIVVEFTASQVGLGKNLFLSAIRLEPELMMSSLFLSILLGSVLYGAIVMVERRWGRWYLMENRQIDG